MKVKVKKTGQTVEVYKHGSRNAYVDAHNCTTEYKPEEVDVVYT